MRVRYKGIKGHDGDYDLGRACLVDGENDTGKSSLVAAIHFALTGKIAAMRMGKGDTQDPGRLLKAIDDGGWAEVTIDGTTVRRVLEATAKKARVLTFCDGLEGKDAEAAAARLSSDLLFADFRRLVAAGDKERADILATYLPQPDDTEKRRWALGQMINHMDAALRPQPKRGKKVEPALAGRMEKEKAVAARAALTKLAEANGCGDQIAAVFEIVKAASDKTTEEFVEMLRGAANVADDARKSAGKVAKEAAKATGDREAAKEIPDLERKVNALRAAAEQTQDAAEARRAWEAKVGDLRTRLDEIVGELARKREEDSDGAAAEATVASAQKALAEAQHGRPAPPDKDAIRELEERAKPLHAERDRLTPLAASQEQKETAAKAAEARLEALAMPERPEGDIEAMRKEREDLLVQIERLRAEGIPLRERRKSAMGGNCPLILSACPVPEELKGFVESSKKTLEGMSKEVLAAKARAEDLAGQIAALSEAQQKYHEEHTAWSVADTSARTAIKTARAAAQEAKHAAERLPDVQVELEPIERELELLREAHQAHEDKFAEWSADVAAANTVLADARSALASAKEVAKRIADLEQDRKRLQAELTAAESKEPAEVDEAEDGDLETLEKRLEDAHAAKARLDVLSGLDIDALTSEAAIKKAAFLGAAEGLMRCVQAATDPVAGKITEALHRMDIEGEFYVDLEARSFGIIENGKRVDVEVLGGGKAILFAGAMLAALPRGDAIRVLTLEGAELHPQWMSRLLRGLDIDAFDSTTVATCHGASEIPEEWNHRTMGVNA